AALRAMESAGVTPEEIDLIIVGTVTPDTFTPSTACYVQANIGAVNAAAFDISAACSGFLFALKTAVQYIGCGQARTALIIASEKLSHIVNWEDRTTCVLFGDGAGAAVLRTGTGKEGDSAILASDIGSDGTLTDLLMVPGGGSAIPTTEENIHEKLYTLAMRGNEVFRHAVAHMKDSALSLIERTGIKPEDVALVVPHQANLRIINAVAQRLGIPVERVFINLQKYGNTSGAACAIALDEAIRAGKAKKGDIVLMVTFGAGLTWSSAAIRL
ncbi:MAG: ketoacyl-ACP synthase III, partial [Akkermansia sp.]|nr:ketoacyl-ACP synthase III [Akkermansia sp.]